MKPAPPSTAFSAPEAFEKRFVKPRKGRTLIVGSQVYGGKEDRRKRYADVLGVDMLPGPGVDQVLDMEEAAPEGLFAHVECMSVLEHSKRPWLLAANVERALEPGGTLFVAVPFCWRIHGYPDDFWRFTPNGIRLLFPGIRWSKVCLGHIEVTDEPKLPNVKRDGIPWFPRTETFGFGVKA